VGSLLLATVRTTTGLGALITAAFPLLWLKEPSSSSFFLLKQMTIAIIFELLLGIRTENL
jgi:hypothetical protein